MAAHLLACVPKLLLQLRYLQVQCLPGLPMLVRLLCQPVTCINQQTVAGTTLGSPAVGDVLDAHCTVRQTLA